ncbi:MAG: UbiD family decarboxylase, partial [Chitinophagaceae bacterium]|nr:UbiD family decarboxylase [Chitinophagaceae bacterium]
TDADFVITGYVYPNQNKPEGPFGDHLGYYSLIHDFPVMKVHKVYARQNAIWPFTVVGRPPQEDTSFGQLIHKLTGKAIQQEIPGLKEVHAVDAAGVHPLLLAVGSERYTPYLPVKQPAEILTIAHHILGTGQLSLAKFLFITADEKQQISAADIPSFLQYFLQRINLERDIHFQTNTTIDTLDYSGERLNSGSKVVLAAYGDVIRELATDIPAILNNLQVFEKPVMVMPGVVALQANKFVNYKTAIEEMELLNKQCLSHTKALQQLAFLIICDDTDFVCKSLNNFLWATFTRCNPSHDMHGIDSFTENKHWGCKGPLIFDARIKPHHAPPLEKNDTIEKRVDRLFEKGGSLYKLA